MASDLRVDGRRPVTPSAGSGRLERLAVASILAVLLVGGLTSAADASRSQGVRPSQELASLLRTHRVYSSPYAGSTRVSTLAARRPITGEQTVLPVVGHTTTRDGTRWLRVMLPGRPNGSLGWITRRGTTASSTSWHLVVRTASPRILVYRHGRLVRWFQAIVGKPSTPTPHGQFFVEESVLMAPAAAGAPFALALSARSNVLQEFDGGPGQIAIHGVENLGGTLGTAESHGCIRLATGAITWLAARIDPGTPVTITS